MNNSYSSLICMKITKCFFKQDASHIIYKIVLSIDITKFIRYKAAVYNLFCDVHHTVSGSSWRDRKSAAANMSI